MRSEVEIASKDFRVRFNEGDRCVTLDLATFSQPLLPEVSIDSLQSFDRSVSVRWDGVRRIDGGERMTWVSQSTLWHKRYFLDVYPGHAEFHAEVSGHGDIDSVRYFDAIADVGFRPHFALTKHFNDGGQTGARAYSSGSPVGFRQVFCPEPNSYAQQFLRPFEDGQVSVNADLEYNGGNFIANPGLLCYAVCAEPDREWLAFGLAVEPGQYLFSEYEYLGGEDFAFNLNAWGACRIDGMFRTPRVVMVVGQSPPGALARYVQKMRDAGLVPDVRREQPQWWSRPIVCGWDPHQTPALRVPSGSSPVRRYA